MGVLAFRPHRNVATVAGISVLVCGLLGLLAHPLTLARGELEHSELVKKSGDINMKLSK